ncbi:nucleotidyltransferase family protein [Variovorax sp. V213]|uniref:nucleotidyltransferase family protein n=1 Tax=Variovorax sp. V213 TaxID=3065955 RepID=UPI0034E859AC
MFGTSGAGCQVVPPLASLDDLFEQRVRHDPIRASAATYRERVTAKRSEERWPRLSISNGRFGNAGYEALVIRRRFCTAAPAAPLPRLSRTALKTI